MTTRLVYTYVTDRDEGQRYPLGAQTLGAAVDEVRRGILDNGPPGETVGVIVSCLATGEEERFSVHVPEED